MTRLAKDTRGNVLAIVAGATVPLAAFIGAGLDLSRAYLVRTRLQQACDAGVLAGRRAMGAGGSLTDPVKRQINDFVVFNFPKTSYDTTTFTVTPALDSKTDTISLTLATDMNTAVMRLFGKDTVPVSVNCSARDDYANIDIVLVLDTTGSMACKPSRDKDDCSNWIFDSRNRKDGKTMKVGTRTVTYVAEETNAAKANISRMEGLRDAVKSLQVQMGIIESQFAVAGSATRKRVRWSIVPFSQMVNPGLSVGAADTTLYERYPSWFNPKGGYREKQSTIKTIDHAAGSYATSKWMTTTWDGCVEERATSNAITGSSNYQIPGNLPSTAHDLMFDTPPTNAATQWTVADDAATGDSQYACPKPMREWDTMGATEFNDYFEFSNGFVANGGTYLDIGMLWAARLLSRTGLWKDDNPTIYHTFPVARYVIFMTDGEMDTLNNGYGAYAQEMWWKRVASDGETETSKANHSKRWLMTCSAIKNMDVDIYAISFGAASTLSTDMQACSSGAGYGYRAADSAALNRAFQDIGENIGSLRLSK